MAEIHSTSIKTGNLLLDSKNSRIPETRRSGNQRALLHELLRHEDVRSLASSISKLGLFPNERLIVVASGSRFVVLEGNRRLAAIKFLLNPELAPTPHQVSYFRRLSDKADLSALGKLDAVVYTNRIAAAPIIGALHTRTPKKRWLPLQQARFYRELIDEGQTADQIATQHGITLSELYNFLRTEKLYRFALTLDYDAQLRQKVEDEKFALTTLARFIESKLGRQLFGVEIDDKDGLRGVVSPRQFEEVLKRVISDIAAKPGMTRKVNDENGFNKYINEIKRSTSVSDSAGSFTLDSLMHKQTGTASGESLESKEKQRKTRLLSQPKGIVPAGFQCDAKNDRVRAIFRELSSFKVIDHRNSVAVMLRVLLDIALWSYMKEKGLADQAIDQIDKEGKRRRNNPNWTPALRDLVSYTVDTKAFPGMSADEYKSVRTLAAKDADYFITIEGFNAFTHNTYATPTETDLRALWSRVEPMLRIILN